MNLRKALMVSLMILLVCAAALSQTKRPAKIYWTKIFLAARSDCKIRVDQKGIFTGGKDCNYGYLLSKGQKVTLRRSIQQKSWTRLVLIPEGDDEPFSLFLKNDSKRGFQNLFRMIFSKRKIKDDWIKCPKIGGTKLQILRNIGFPDTFRINGDKEVFHFGLGFGSVCGFDMRDITVEKGRIAYIGGII